MTHPADVALRDAHTASRDLTDYLHTVRSCAANGSPPIPADVTLIRARLADATRRVERLASLLEQAPTDSPEVGQ